jgi:hypothetical protein
MAFSVFDENTPTEISDEIKQFCDEVAHGESPFFVSLLPHRHATINRCHVNVEDFIRMNGGSPVYGWLIWKSKALLNAVFHCIWQSPIGQFVDITPQPDGEKAILFLPDVSRQWHGRIVPSRMKARIKSSPLFRLIKIHGQIDNLYAAYRPDQPFSQYDTARLGSLGREAFKLSSQIQQSWVTDPSQSSKSAHSLRAKRKAERQRRNQQRKRRN